MGYNLNELWDIEDELLEEVQPVRTSRKPKVRVTVTHNGRSRRKARKLKLYNSTQTENYEGYGKTMGTIS